MKRLLYQLSLLSILVMLSASCISTYSASGPSSRELLEAGPNTEATANSADIQDLIKVRDYMTALRALDQLWNSNKDDYLIKEYSQLAEKIRNAGDREYEQGNFARAGSLFNGLLESRMITENSSNSLSFTREYLKKQIKACSKALTELGIIKYREQKLNEAIAIWQQILQFEPQNSAITKAIATASRQQYSLSQIK